MISVTFQRLCDVCGESSDVGRVSLVADTRPEGSTARPEVTLPGDTQGPRDIHRALLVVPLHHIGWPTRHKDAIIMAHTPHLGTGADKRKTKSHSNQCLEDTSPTKRRTVLYLISAPWCPCWEDINRMEITEDNIQRAE